MASLEELRNERLKKLENLKDKGLNPYPSKSSRKERISGFLSDFRERLSSKEETVLAGRIMALRNFGGSIFADLNDGSETVQLYLKKENLEEELFNLFSENIDIGDFIEAEGSAFETKKGESSLAVRSWNILSKSLRPLPEKWHGLQDTEERFRKRYLDLLLNEDLRELFRKKALFWKSVREFLEKEGFLEVETPALEITTGGAEAKPFKTHHNDFDLDIFLRISVGELWQKRLMAAGFERTFEIGKIFRNEGSSPEHVQEFTNMEFYASYMSFEEGKELIKRLYREVAKKVFKASKFEAKDYKFDLDDEWEELDYVSTVEKITGVNVLEAEENDLQKKLGELGVKYEGETRERMIDSLWKYCRKKISGPAFLINHPKLVAPLSKEHPDNPKLTKTFQVILAGSEMGRAHSELNNPLEQKKRFEKQQKLLEKGDEEAMMPDWEFVEMLEYGMPPTFGFGFGERFFAYLAGKSIREIQMFPLMKPRD